MPTPIEPTFWSETLKIVPIAAGAMLAIFSGVMTQVLTHKFSEEREKKKLLREKIEALVQHLYEYGEWLNDKVHMNLVTEEFHKKPSPLDKAFMLQKLYFPELQTSLQKIYAVGLPIVYFAVKSRIDNLGHPENRNNFLGDSTYMNMQINYSNVFEDEIGNISLVLQEHLRNDDYLVWFKAVLVNLKLKILNMLK